MSKRWPRRLPIHNSSLRTPRMQTEAIGECTSGFWGIEHRCCAMASRQKTAPEPLLGKSTCESCRRKNTSTQSVVAVWVASRPLRQKPSAFSAVGEWLLQSRLGTWTFSGRSLIHFSGHKTAFWSSYFYPRPSKPLVFTVRHRMPVSLVIIHFVISHGRFLFATYTWKKSQIAI